MGSWGIDGELQRLLAEVPFEAETPEQVTPLGVDDLLPRGWPDEAHHLGRSPWDAELRVTRLKAIEEELLAVLDDPADPATPALGRVPRDRRVTELDWRQLLPAQDA